MFGLEFSLLSITWLAGSSAFASYFSESVGVLMTS